MIVKNLTFTNLDGEEVTETHYFGLTKKRIIDLEKMTPGGIVAKFESLAKLKNGLEIMNAFNEIIGYAYGIRVNSNKFEQSPEISDDFLNSMAYEALLTELLGNPEATGEFVNGMLPGDISSSPEAIKALVASHADDEPLSPDSGPDPESSGLKTPHDKDGNLLAWAFRPPTTKERVAMTKTQLEDVFVRMSSGWTPPQQ